MKRCILFMLVLLMPGLAHSWELSPDAIAAKLLLENIISGDTSKALTQFDSSLGDPKQVENGISGIKTLFSSTASRQYYFENRSWLKTTSGKFFDGELRIEENGGRSYILKYHCKDSNGNYLFDKFRVFLVTKEERERAQFSFRNRSVGQYLVMTVAIFNVVFSIYSAFMAWRSGVRRRALWTFVCLISVVTVNVAWVPSVFLSVPVPLSTNFLQFLFLGAAFGHQGTYNPYVLSVGVPLGAMLFWRAKRKWDAKASTENIPAA